MTSTSWRRLRAAFCTGKRAEQKWCSKSLGMALTSDSFAFTPIQVAVSEHNRSMFSLERLMLCMLRKAKPKTDLRGFLLSLLEHFSQQPQRITYFKMQSTQSGSGLRLWDHVRSGACKQTTSVFSNKTFWENLTRKHRELVKKLGNREKYSMKSIDSLLHPFLAKF